MHVVGTAGHVDHGKSTLIHALTGIDPDRLQEEKERGMTIDLGFAWLRLPSGREVSIVDVPGHERFIKNMLAGVGGVDVALLIVAADEGIMPQTREHLAILDLLEIRSGIAVVTKADLVDQEWLDLVTEEVAEVLTTTSLAGAPIVAVSAVTGQGLDVLVAKLDELLAVAPGKRNTGRPRLPIDRVFTVAGFGTVVTGTLVDGELHVGQEVEILPAGVRTRVRGLQTHKRRVERAPAGQRVAVNLAGVDAARLQRGDVLSSPGWLRPTTLIDARLRLVADAPKPLRHNTPVTFHTGAMETMAKVYLLDREEIGPGERGWVQLRLATPAAVVKEDLFVLRFPSPSATVGGGRIVDPHPRRHRRFQSRVLARLAVLERGEPADMVLEQLRAQEPADLATLVRRSTLSDDEVRGIVGQLVAQGRVVALANGDDGAELSPQTLLVSDTGWARLVDAVETLLATYHKEHPLRWGMPREELRTRLGVDARLFTRLVPLLVAQGRVAEEGPKLRLPSHQVTLTPEQEERVRQLFAILSEAGPAPPARAELERRCGLPPEVLDVLIERGELIAVSPELVYLRRTYEDLVARVVEAIRERGPITAAQVRDLLNTSRRYVLPLLEHLDERRVTRRVGDERVLYGR